MLEDFANTYMVDDATALQFADECQTLEELDLGSCSIQFVTHPDHDGPVLIVTASSGHAAIIPTIGAA